MLKVALVGVGGISGAHIPAWESMDDAELVAIWLCAGHAGGRAGGGVCLLRVAGRRVGGRRPAATDAPALQTFRPQSPHSKRAAASIMLPHLKLHADGFRLIC